MIYFLSSVYAYCLDAESVQHVHHVLCSHVTGSPLSVGAATQSRHRGVHHTNAVLHNRKRNHMRTKLSVEGI